jgi:hypothetical protein
LSTNKQHFFFMHILNPTKTLNLYTGDVIRADLVIKDFQLAGVRNVMTVRHEFHGSCADPQCNGEASHVDVNGALDAAVKEKLDNYQQDYNARNYFFIAAVMTTQGESVETSSVCYTYYRISKQRTISHA